MGLLLMVKNCVTCLSMVTLFTASGVCGQQWSVTYRSQRVCGFVGGSVEMSCSYTYPSGLALYQAYWTNENKEDPRDLTYDPNYSSRTTVHWYGTNERRLHINQLTASDAGHYYCRITTGTAGERWIGTPGVQLYVRDSQQVPSVSIIPPGDILEGTQVTLTCNSRNYPPGLSYWYKIGSYTALEPSTQSTLTFYPIRSTDGGEYYCQITDAICQWNSALVKLQVYYPPRTPKVMIDPPGQITEGSRVTLICSTDGNPPAHTYNWYKRGSSYSLKKEQVLVFTNIHIQDRGKYCCEASNDHGHNRSPDVDLNVAYPPRNTKIGVEPSGEIAEGSRVTLTCSTDADPPAHTYDWYKGRDRVTQQNSKQTLTFSDIRSGDSGKYTCQAISTQGNSISLEKELDVAYPPRTPEVVINPPGLITEGSRVTLNCNSDAHPPVEKYTWFKVNESTPVGSGQQYNITNIRSEDGGQYYCEASNRFGSQKSTALSITDEGEQSPAGEQRPLVTAVIIAVSACGAVGLLCVVVMARRRCKEVMTQTIQGQETRDYVNVAQSGNKDASQPDAVYQSLNPNTIQPDVYQSMNPNTTQPDAVYQTLHVNAI